MHWTCKLGSIKMLNYDFNLITVTLLATILWRGLDMKKTSYCKMGYLKPVSFKKKMSVRKFLHEKKKWKYDENLSYRPARSHIIFVWGKNIRARIPNYFKFCFFFFCPQLVSPFKKNERKQSVPLSCLNLYKDAILADFFPLGMPFWREFTSFSTPQVLCGHSLTAAPSEANNNTALHIFLPTTLPCGYLNRADTPCVSARFFQEHLLADCAAQLWFRAESLRSVFTVGASRQAWMCSVTVFDCIVIIQVRGLAVQWRCGMSDALQLGNKFRLWKGFIFFGQLDGFT